MKALAKLRLFKFSWGICLEELQYHYRNDDIDRCSTYYLFYGSHKKIEEVDWLAEEPRSACSQQGRGEDSCNTNGHWVCLLTTFPPTHTQTKPYTHKL
jgi:hypothetical protein